MRLSNAAVKYLVAPEANALDQICQGTLDRLIEVLPVLGKPLASVEPNNGADGPPGDGTPEYDLDAAVVNFVRGWCNIEPG